MSANQQIQIETPRASDPTSKKITSLATSVTGAATLGLFGAIIAPSLPIVAAGAASVGLVAGYFFAKLDQR